MLWAAGNEPSMTPESYEKQVDSVAYTELTSKEHKENDCELVNGENVVLENNFTT